jgi:phosphatidate cytidylyltransferase
MENTGLRNRYQSNHTADKSAGSILRSDSSFEVDPPTLEVQPPTNNEASTPPQNSESRPLKILTRAISGLIMLTLFIAILLSGHLYVCAFVTGAHILLFRELVTVRYHAFFDRIEETIPLFRTTQWMWFCTAIFYAYSEFVVEVLIKSNTKLHYFIDYAQLAPALSFMLYTTTFVVTIATFQPGHIRFQLNQLCWTMVVLCLTVGQTKYIMHNIYNGLIWFTLPILLVITNDVMAYFSGITCGRKFVRRPFMLVSPNKTWEGFIGGGEMNNLNADDIL